MIRFISLALIIRIVLIPITFHGDLIWVQTWPSLWAFFGHFDGYGYMVENYAELLQTYGVFYYGPFTYLTIGLWQHIAQLFAPDMGMWLIDVLNQTQDTLTSQTLLTTPTASIKSFLTWFKIPYLLADLTCGALLWILAPSQRKTSLLLWGLNPALIYATYMFGQLDIFIALSLLGFFYSYKRNRLHLAFICLGIGFAYKNATLFVIAPALILCNTNLRSFIRYSLCFAIPIVLSTGLFWIHSPSILGWLLPGVIQDKLVGHNEVEWGKIIKLGLLAFNYGLLLIHCFRIKLRAPHVDIYQQLIYTFTASFLLVYCFLSVTVHYFVWSLPCLILLALNEPKYTKYIWILTGCMMLYKIKKASMCLGLFAPLNPEFFYALPGLQDIPGPITWKNLVKIFRVGFIVTSFFIMYECFKPAQAKK